MIHFVGAGSGAPDLITVRGQRFLREADVVIYAGSLVNPEPDLRKAIPDTLLRIGHIERKLLYRKHSRNFSACFPSYFPTSAYCFMLPRFTRFL